MSRSVTTLTGRWAVVTGASGGIGSRIADRLWHAGANVVLHAHLTRDKPERQAQSIRDAGGMAHVVSADLGQQEAVIPFVQHCWELTGGIDIWINNAGADVLTGESADLDFAAKLQRLWQVDVLGTILASRHVGKQMKSRARGVILNMGWDQAASGMSGDSGEMFAATKGAIMAFTRSLAKSLAPDVRVNCLAPGWIRTSWGQQQHGYWSRRARQESLRQRWGTPDDVAQAAVFLTSPAADFITGHILPVNGGLAGIENWSALFNDSGV